MPLPIKQSRYSILVVEVNWIGDVLFSTAALRALRAKHLDAFIACLVHPRCTEVLEGNPSIDEILTIDEKGKHWSPFAKLHLIMQLRKRKFDTAYLLHRSWTRVFMCFVAGIKNRIGFATSKGRSLLTECVAIPSAPLHRAAYYYYLFHRTIERNPEVLRSDFFVRQNDVETINNLLKHYQLEQNVSFVVIHSAGNWSLKRWPKENFIQLAQALVQCYQVPVVFSGAQAESVLITEIVSAVQGKVVNLCGKTTLKQLGALFQKAALVISADSGPLHISVALGCRTIALFGPTSPEITGPLTQDNIAVLAKSVDCERPCYQLDCADNLCMKLISVSDVIQRIEQKKWLKKKP